MKIRNKELHRLFIIAAILFALMSVFFTIAVSSWFYVGLPLAMVIMGNSSGVQFDIDERRYRNYKRFCFWTYGEWKNIGENKNLVVLVKHGVQTTAGTMLTGSLETKGGFSELYLMDGSHINRFFIDSSGNHKKIDLLAIELSQLLNVQIKTYNPEI